MGIKSKITTRTVDLLKKKATQTLCTFRVAAIGFNSRGESVIRTCNEYRFSREGGGLHAEEKIFKVAKRKNIKTILICRISRTGNLLPIDPCNRCMKTANKLGIKIVSIER